MDGFDGECKKDEICEHFSDLNIVLENDVLDKCVEMCKTYDVDPEDFCDQWFAFTTTELQGDVPTLENLQRFEKKEFMKIKRSFSTPKQDSQYGKTAKFHITTPKVSKSEGQKNEILLAVKKRTLRTLPSYDLVNAVDK